MANGNNFAALLRKQIESERLVLPVFNAVSLRIQIELVKREPDLRAVEKLIVADQALSSNILKIANSARYRGLVETSTVKAAILRLGMTEIARIVSLDIAKKMFTSRDGRLDAILKKLWQHSLGCAFAAGMLSNRLDFGVMQNEAFFAGLFHDIGKLLVLKVVAEKKPKNKSLDVPEELLLDAMDILHAEQGFLLLQQIKMPPTFAVIARDHHLPEYDRDNYLLVLVRMANHICHKQGIGLRQDPDIDLLTMDEALALRLSPLELENVQTFLESTSGLVD